MAGHDHLITQCINGGRVPNCEWCPESPEKNGDCCYGIRHEYHDDDCTQCSLENDCAAETHRQVEPSRSQRIVYPGRSTTNRNSSRRVVRPSGRSSLTVLNNQSPQQGEPLLVQQQVEPTPIQLSSKDNLAVRFVKVGAWGAFEGWLEMGLHFARKYRPKP